MHCENEPSIASAVALHRKGLATEAKAIYEQLLSVDQNDANVIGLLGVIAIQEGDRQRAELLWRRSLSLNSRAFIYIRNINNLIVTLLEDSREREARALLEGAELPTWADNSPPDESELKSIVSLALCLERFNLIKKARALLEPIAALSPADSEALRLLASLRFEDKDFPAALDILRNFSGSDDLWTMTTRLRCEGEMGLPAEVEIDYDKVLQHASVYVSKDLRQDLKTVLVINSGGNFDATNSLFDLHFRHNFPCQLARMTDRFNFISVFWDSKYIENIDLKPDIVLNNIVNGELILSASDTRDKLSRLADSLGVPVINHPQRAALTTRQRVAFSLKELDNVVVPKTIRFKADSNELRVQVVSLEHAFNYPIIIRTTRNNVGVGMERVDDRDELIRELTARTGRQIYAHEYIENRSEEGYFRKFRAVFVGDKIIPIRLDYHEEWKVTGRGRPARQLFYRQRRHLLEFEKKIIENIPNEVLTHDVMSALADIRAKIPLDVFGIDFDVLPNGKILFFEANASMNFFSQRYLEEQDLRHPASAEVLVVKELVQYIMRRIDSKD